MTNGDAISVSQFWAPAFSASGIVQYAFVPSAGTTGKNNWPTLDSMIDTGKRLVVFMDYNSDTAAAPYILPEFNHVYGIRQLSDYVAHSPFAAGKPNLTKRIPTSPAR